ncbi:MULTISPECIES: branched-chain amino acid ABC transporter permease [Enterococcaceae]|uniref:branched-chain amino acid ABC transporter permease n=1 Tax=Enterococcaceae TaxID=81852 RepID=UPI000E4FB2BB|nr:MULTISPECIES: branched-chain amino acid ABC transporter permease [Enterococcaceae]RGI31745.1 branched-chain amino acid ABC transporter permease [Melissococcus sp. OM08-11BH]UNM90491.1 branched-chain amino acid ABC transporter permease [Vagococcus sp. CY52-2]
MKERLKINGIWLAIMVVIFAMLAITYSTGLMSPVVETTLVMIGINIILAAGLNLVIGISGQFSLGHAGFMAIGAYTTAIMTIKMPSIVGFLIGLVLGCILSGIVALLVGIPTLRLSGDYLAIATLGVSEIIRSLIMNMDQITNGPAGLFGIPPFVTWSMVYLFVCITLILMTNYIHSAAGRATLSVRENLIAAESMGVNVTKYKVVAFVIGAMTAAVAGGMYSSYVQTIVPGNFDFMKSIDILIIVVFGGVGSMTGTVVAAVLLGVLNMYLQDFGAIRMIIYAFALVIIMIFKPSGLLGTKEFSVKKLLSKGGKQHV